MDKIDFVRKYLERGWGVTPVASPEEGNKDTGKRPILDAWQRNPVRTIEDAAQYWTDGEYNVGILTGDASRIIVLDIDVPEKFEVFLDKHPECRNTYIVKRNNADAGKCHYYFSLPEGIHAPGSKRIGSTGWGDLQSNGTQVVAPPSVHYTGGIYEANDAEPLPFNEEYLVDLLLPEEKTEAKKDKKIATFESINVMIQEGAKEGCRNSTLFEICKQLRTASVPRKKAVELAIEFCQHCSPVYDTNEALKTVSSVYSISSPLDKLNYSKKCVDSEDAEEEKPRYELKPLTYDKVTEKLLALSVGKVAKIDDELFIVPEQAGGKIEFISNAVDYFSFLGNKYKGCIDWYKGVKFMSKEEAFCSLKRGIKTYNGIECAPHYPLVKNLFYNHPPLPKPDYAVLNELIGFFTPETEEDRALIIAMFLSCFWGGPAGQRAPFVITSKDGRGVGKSTLGETAAMIAGGSPVMGSTKDRANDLVTRLLSPDARSKRVVIFDNEVGSGGRISNSDIASLFTTETISGRRLYVGDGSRQNNFVWIMTLNSPTLDSDFAQRCIPIALSRPAYSANWKQDLFNFIQAKRWIVIATLIDILSKHSIPVTPQIRWGLWLTEVLAKVPNINIERVQEIIRSRQGEFDDEADEGQMIVDEIVSSIQHRYDIDSDEVRIPNKTMCAIVKDAIDVKWSPRFALRRVSELVSSKRIPQLRNYRNKNFRGFVWTGEKYNGQETKTLGAIPEQR